MVDCKLCNNKKAAFFYKVNKYSYYFCKHCKTLFLHPMPDKNKTSSYYKHDFNYAHDFEQKQTIKNRATLILDKLRKLNKNGKTLLDIGSGYGFFLQEARKLGFNTLGIEPSKSLYLYSTKHIKLSVINSSFEEYLKNNSDKKFDYITIIHTLEHLYNPEKIINAAIKILNKNGILYIETPNLDSHLFYFEKESYTFLTPPDHIWIFSQSSLKYLIFNIKTANIKQITTYSFPEHFVGIAKLILNSNKKNITDLNSNSKYIYPSNNISNFKSLKYIIFDKFLAVYLTPLLNIFNKGSILGFYIGNN